LAAAAEPAPANSFGAPVTAIGKDRLAEAESILKAHQPADEATANVAFLKKLLSRKEGARALADSTKTTATGRPE